MKAIVFDFDGTLTKDRKGSNCWYEVWKYIDDLDYDDYLYGLYKNKKINDEEWFNLIFDRYKQKGVKREYLCDISASIQVLPGAYDTIKTLHDSGVKIFVLSGGIRQIIDDVLGREQIGQFVTSIEAYDLIFDKSGKLIDYNRPFVHNIENKNEYIEIIKKQYNLNSEDILFVGNGANDEMVYLSGVRTLCINPDDADITNKKAWTYAIESCDNLSQILHYCNDKTQIFMSDNTNQNSIDNTKQLKLFSLDSQQYPDLDIECQVIDDMKAFVDSCLDNMEQKGEYPKYAQKTAFVTARPGVVGEEVDTRPRVERDGKYYVFSETKGKVKVEGSMIVRNPDGEEYILRPQTFAKKYRETEQKGVYEPIAEPIKYITIDRDIVFTSSWGELMFGLKGAVLNISNLDNIYAIQNEAFYQKYTSKEPKIAELGE